MLLLLTLKNENPLNIQEIWSYFSEKGCFTLGVVVGSCQLIYSKISINETVNEYCSVPYNKKLFSEQIRTAWLGVNKVDYTKNVPLENYYFRVLRKQQN